MRDPIYRATWTGPIDLTRVAALKTGQLFNAESCCQYSLTPTGFFETFIGKRASKVDVSP
jgi:hypothetical protein